MTKDFSEAKGETIMLDIKKTLENGNATFVLEGRLDTVTAPQLEDALKESLDSAQTLTMDFEKLGYISSAGLRVLLITQKKMGAKGGMTLVHVNDTVREILEVTGFSEILTIQ